MGIFAESMPAEIKQNEEVIHEDEEHKRARLLGRHNGNTEIHDQYVYLQAGWLVYKHVTSRPWFEIFILLNILLIGLFTGLDLEANGDDPAIRTGMQYVSAITTASFTLEIFCKLIVEGFEPLNYFNDQRVGRYNCFDFAIGKN